jgi:hypothetical protein
VRSYTPPLQRHEKGRACVVGEATEVELMSTTSYQINFRNALMLRSGCLKHHRCHRLANGTDGHHFGKGRIGSLLRPSAVTAHPSPSQIMKQLICREPDAFNLGTVSSVPPPRCGPQIYVLRLSVRRVPPPPVSRCVALSYFPTSVPWAPLDVANEPHSRLPFSSRPDLL